MVVDLLIIQLLEQNIRVESVDFEEAVGFGSVDCDDAIGVDSMDKEDSSLVDSGLKQGTNSYVTSDLGFIAADTNADL